MSVASHTLHHTVFAGVSRLKRIWRGPKMLVTLHTLKKKRVSYEDELFSESIVDMSGRITITGDDFTFLSSEIPRP